MSGVCANGLDATHTSHTIFSALREWVNIQRALKDGNRFNNWKETIFLCGVEQSGAEWSGVERSGDWFTTSYFSESGHATFHPTVSWLKVPQRVYTCFHD
mmetsp:Transcript_11807/g.19999  ORF Transcript_11807/g.19999 Transcript_11807/m.19999 type:complete len:100 (-) Transcript_11807:52-351(-)